MSKSVKGLEYLGSITVDSGQAIIGDPCYLDEWKFWDDKEPFDNYPQHKGEYGYLGSCNATLTDGFGNLGLANAVAFTTGYGDGMYHVYGELDGKRVLKVVIDFDPEDEEEDDNETQQDAEDLAMFNKYKVETLCELWMNFRDEENLKEFVAFNDMGLPLAFFVAAGIVEASPRAEELISETFNSLLIALNVSLDEILRFDDFRALLDYSKSKRK